MSGVSKITLKSLIAMLEGIMSGVGYMVYVPEILEKLEALARSGHSYLEEIKEKGVWTSVRHPSGLLQWKVENGKFSLMLDGELVLDELASDEGYLVNFSELPEETDDQASVEIFEQEPVAA